jgi:hypothetical protein
MISFVRVIRHVNTAHATGTCNLESLMVSDGRKAVYTQVPWSGFNGWRSQARGRPDAVLRAARLVWRHA